MGPVLGSRLLSNPSVTLSNLSQPVPVRPYLGGKPGPQSAPRVASKTTPIYTAKSRSAKKRPSTLMRPNIIHDNAGLSSLKSRECLIALRNLSGVACSPSPSCRGDSMPLILPESTYPGQSRPQVHTQCGSAWHRRPRTSISMEKITYPLRTSYRAISSIPLGEIPDSRLRCRPHPGPGGGDPWGIGRFPELAARRPPR